MAFGGDYKDNFYAGADYGFDPSMASEYSVGFTPGTNYPMSTADFAVVSDPRTANQLAAVSSRLNTGAKTIEVSGTFPQQFENLPNQHLDEIHRLKKLTNVDFTFHGPLVEPSGWAGQAGWNESTREQAERQMWSALKRAHRIDPKGNLNVTFHSSNGLPETLTKVKTKIIDPLSGKEKEIEQIKSYFVVNQITGAAQPITPTPDYFTGKEGTLIASIAEQEKAVKKFIEKQNEETWLKQLHSVGYNAHYGDNTIRGALQQVQSENLSKEQLLQMFKEYEQSGSQMQELLSAAEKGGGTATKILQDIGHGQVFLKDSYHDLQNFFNTAYETALKNKNTEDLKKLDSYRKEISSKLDYVRDPTKMVEFSEMVMKGVDVLRSIDTPQILQPLQDFGIEKSAKTFANLAFKAYDEFTDSAPIVSIENPPAGGQHGLSRADELRRIVDAARGQLKDRLMSEKKMKEKDAMRQAEKLIGVTWDVGHINMLRKYGYDKDDIVKETERISKYVNKIHLSDNFGLEHTELPMGMGNVPVKPMIEAIEKYNKQLKKVIETGTWFGPQAFGNSYPLRESLRAFGSPIYSMKMGPSWQGQSDTSGGYFSGYGAMLPDTHFSMYGAGFSNLPPALGGQMSGRSRASGAPIE